LNQLTDLDEILYGGDAITGAEVQTCEVDALILL
jgi:hypothetical protein